MLGPPLSHVPSSLQFMLHCMGLLLAQSGHPNTLNQCLLLGVKRTSRGRAPMSAFDPKWTLGHAGRSRILPRVAEIAAEQET